MARACFRPSLVALALLGVLAAGCSRRETAVGAVHGKRMIVLGIDGMDPQLTRQYLDAGRLPNLAKLVAAGGYLPLATTNPPQSPVAWSSVITGLTTAGHGIFDFVHRDAHDVSPYLSTSRTREPTTLSLGGLEIPLGAPTVELLRAGDAFWQLMEHAHVPASVIKIPANYPPAESEWNVSTAGMGTPDLLGTYGTFQLITSDPGIPRQLSGGLVHAAEQASASLYRATLEGPPADGKPLRLDVTVAVDGAGEDERAAVSIGDTDLVLKRGEWSGWIPVAFDPGALSSNVKGMVLLYAKRLRPELELYVSPINLDPMDPVLPLSAPPEFVGDQARAAGRFYTQGMAQDTKALSGDVLDDAEFLRQADIVLEEEERLLDVALRDFRGGLLFYYFSSIDQVSHMFFRTLEPDAAPEDARHAHVIPDLYARIDRSIGKVMAQMGPDTALVIMSDHGFSPYRYKVNLNTWLANNGYLALREDGKRGEGPLGHIDWQNTQAYALGLNQLFINQAGREPFGVVPAAERDVLITRLKRELESWRDSDSGLRVVTRVTPVEPGAFPERAPDLLVGYNRTFRSSDESAMGLVMEKEIERNRGKWSGDHCMEPEHVPGVLFTSMPLPARAASLVDLAPTILGYFDVPAPAGLAGRNLLAAGKQSP